MSSKENMKKEKCTIKDHLVKIIFTGNDICKINKHKNFK